MEAARHDSLADQLLELHGLEEARVAGEEEARVAAALEARQREESEARRRHEEEQEARRCAKEQALLEARAQREAEERRALKVLEAEFRIKAKQEAQARAAELHHQLEREKEGTANTAVEKAKAHARWVTVGAIAIMLIATGAYGFIVKPEMERQELEIASMRQEAQLLLKENDGLNQGLEELQSNLERMELEKRELKQPPRAPNQPKQRPAATRKPEPRRVKEPACANENDPLCGLPLK
jgi:hypothetical protein